MLKGCGLGFRVNVKLKLDSEGFQMIVNAVSESTGQEVGIRLMLKAGVKWQKARLRLKGLRYGLEVFCFLFGFRMIPKADATFFVCFKFYRSLRQ